LKGIIFTILISASLLCTAFGQSHAPASVNAGCGNLDTSFIGGHPQSPAVIFGRPFIVPNVRIRFVSANTGQPLVGKEVIVRYVWRWLEYPRQEHPFGAWSDGYDLVRCITDENGVISVTEREVVPRGWYRGRYTLGRKPSFRHLDISIHTERSIIHRQIERRNLEGLRRRNQREVTLSISA
jgi:hypothetical protein